nr:putative ribonuclease H-like domain-containing protein [Tanacetum cinerariifolium]
MSYLSEYEPYDGGYVSFGQGGSKITGKGINKTGKLEFENVYFVKDLKYNLFSVSQICDNKNSVLFTDSECIVLEKDFKLRDDTNVLLRTPRQHNMYSVDLNNIVPHKNLTCLVAKSSADESMLWHRRLGHLNFKTMNKLVRHNLVKGLPSKCYENDHTCVSRLKGKQHKASYKTKLVNYVSKPLYTLHMDLFGPTFFSSLNHKWYCLVVTDDFSKFTWTFFLRTKDETSGILRNFITEIENLKDLKVKIISNARTPQQNGVAERRNRTLIEAARTMLADAKLPVTFWAEAVNTACYVQNMVLGEGSAIPTEPHHSSSPQEQHSSHHDTSSPSHLTSPTEQIPLIPTETLTETPTLRQYSRRATRIAQSKALSPITSALPYESTPRVTSLDADEGSMQQQLQELMVFCTGLQRQQTQIAAKIQDQDLVISSLKARVKIRKDKDKRREEPTQEDALIKGGKAANILTSGVAAVSVSPVARVLIVGVPTVTKDKGKEKVVESEEPKKKKLQEQIDAQVVREIEEEIKREDQRMNEQLARYAEIARIHAEEELKMLIDGLDRSNEVISKHLQEYEQSEAELTIGEKIELINELVKYQDHHAKILKYQAQQSKPLSKKEQRELYMSVLRSHAGWKTKHFRGMTLEEIKEKFIPVWKQIKDFMPMLSTEEAERVKRKGLKLDQGSSKRIKTSEDVSEEDLKGMMQLVPVEEVAEIAESSHLGDKMKYMFERSRGEDESLSRMMLISALHIGSLWDLETVWPRCQVGKSLKAGFVADMKVQK